MSYLFDVDRPSILSYLHDPSHPPALIEAFFAAALDYADAAPWARLSPSAHFPILLGFAGDAQPAHRLAMILGGEGSGGDAVGLVLVDDLPDEAAGLTQPALAVIYAGYPEGDRPRLLLGGRPLPRSRAGLLPFPTVHDVDDRVRAPRQPELLMMLGGLLAVHAFLGSYPERALDDATALPHACQVTCALPPGRLVITARTFPVPR